MAYAFRIHEAKVPAATSPISAGLMNSWSKTGHIAGNLLDNIQLGVAGNKMGTSIPSMFARIFLFEGAFQTLNGANIGTLTANSIDTQLISECFDMLEFIFQHGNDPRLVVKRWNATQQINALNASKYQEHKDFAKVISDEVAQHSGLQDIFLFFWNAPTANSITPVETLIGGTSPYTLVFTSPNWKKAMQVNGYNDFKGLTGQPLFMGNVLPLRQRGQAFKNMVYALYSAYDAALNAHARFLKGHIHTMMNADGVAPADTGMAGDPTAFINRYIPVADTNGGQVQIAAVPLCYEKVTPQASGYEIEPTSTRYQTYKDENGVPIDLKKPLVLNENGLGAGVNYAGSADWNSTTCQINEATVRTTPLHERVLPGNMGITHPFLIWSDFLEDKIIKLPYNIDSDRFVTASNGGMRYLLPLKRTFFKYFNIDDIDQPANGTNKKLVEVSIESDVVTIAINVPIADKVHRTIELKKCYKGEDIISNSPFLIGFYPFYRVNKNNLNRYNILNCGNDSALSFFSFADLDRTMDVTPKQRTQAGKITSKTEHYCVKSSFDLIEVSVGGIQGIIIPKMQEIGLPTNTFKFAVDFGTSNTYIAHIDNNHLTPTTLEIDDHDAQTVFLTKDGSRGQRLDPMKSFIAREFMPIAIGGNAEISYPCRTAVCEIANFQEVTPDLFSTINIGFNMMNEPVCALQSKYKTGLKWLLENAPGDPHHTNRVKFFFLQTLWMLKNESFLNDGDDAFEVYITFPETMKAPTRVALMSLWDQAKAELNLRCTFIHGINYSESIAPYNCFANTIGGSSYLNIDIGGGTNDLLYVLKNAAGHIQAANYSSALFAGDDIWGDGIIVNAVGNSNNGFVDYLINGTDNNPGILVNQNIYPQEVILTLKALMGGVSTSSADIMGFLFKHENTFNTSQKIQGCAPLYSLVFIHYAAIMYNVARLIKKMGVEIPEKMSFTGMGSKYINLISTDTMILNCLTKLLLEKYTGKTAPSTFTTISSNAYDVKEITAKGVLVGLSIGAGFRIPAGVIKGVSDYGFDVNESITYNDISANPTIREQALKEFDSFVDTLKARDFKQFIYDTFSLIIPDKLLDDLKTFGQQSFVTMSAAIPVAHRGLDVKETLFFWPLKNALTEISKLHAQY